jgi:DNA-directed RNA polymerase specialized sigma24 family protein
MSRRHDKETSRGRPEPFPVTHWTEIFDARSDNEPRRQAALEDLLTTYWKPVYCYLRSKGHDKEASKDLTQGFFHEVVLGRNLIQNADRERGTFRTFLLMALERYAVSAQRAEKAKRRMPEGGLVRLEGIEELSMPDAVHRGAPHEVFDYVWASSLLDRVLAEVGEECRTKGKSSHWQVFQARVLRPLMDDSKPPSLTQLCAEYGIPTETRASKMIVAVKRWFRAALRRHVRQFVDSDTEVDEEIRYLLSVFSMSNGRS